MWFKHLFFILLFCRLFSFTVFSSHIINFSTTTAILPLGMFFFFFILRLLVSSVSVVQVSYSYFSFSSLYFFSFLVFPSHIINFSPTNAILSPQRTVSCFFFFYLSFVMTTHVFFQSGTSYLYFFFFYFFMLFVLIFFRGVPFSQDINNFSPTSATSPLRIYIFYLSSGIARVFLQCGSSILFFTSLLYLKLL